MTLIFGFVESDCYEVGVSSAKAAIGSSRVDGEPNDRLPAAWASGFAVLTGSSGVRL